MTIVLVHGAWSGSWSWRDVRRLLSAKGYEVIAPTLSGLAERAHIKPDQVSLQSHIQDVAGLLHYEDLSRVLLVGHSYGGMVITGAADRMVERLAGLVYVDAFLPENGQSLFDIVPPYSRLTQESAAQAHDGGQSVPRAPQANMSQSDVQQAGMQQNGDAARWAGLFSAQPIGTLRQPYVSVRDAKTMDVSQWPPRHYALCTAYKGSVFHQMAAKVDGQAGWTLSQFDAGHDVVRTHPHWVAARIEEIAQNLGIAKSFSKKL
jgi:pimeloyl-ACP methyl ester carboxylesterase